LGWYTRELSQEKKYRKRDEKIKIQKIISLQKESSKRKSKRQKLCDRQGQQWSLKKLVMLNSII
jgi:hypothetical protein